MLSVSWRWKRQPIILSVSKKQLLPHSKKRMGGAIFSMLHWLLRPGFFKNSPEGSDFQWMRCILLLKWDNAVDTAMEFGLLSSLNHRILFPVLCYWSTWTDLKAAMSGYSFPLLLPSGLYMLICNIYRGIFPLEGFMCICRPAVWCQQRHKGESRQPLGRIKLLGTHLGIQDGEEIGPTHTYKISRVRALTCSFQPKPTCLPCATTLWL